METKSKKYRYRYSVSASTQIKILILVSVCKKVVSVHPYFPSHTYTENCCNITHLHTELLQYHTLTHTLTHISSAISQYLHIELLQYHTLTHTDTHNFCNITIPTHRTAAISQIPTHTLTHRTAAISQYLHTITNITSLIYQYLHTHALTHACTNTLQTSLFLCGQFRLSARWPGTPLHDNQAGNE